MNARSVLLYEGQAVRATSTASGRAFSFFSPVLDL